ncbi:DNA binding domain-containing protein, excisionase family [Cnuella takakiae]|uniref:DNA binding domain-containing protein, excisionase family n=1 Tax=Cnuella takakiae TaxID=1302690 RepID=A0A1M5CER7_9BACT|nr:helix-turn-helix domain-containing protein [Cnuella takakiae]OLY91793.1 hypothetical protein BUE76_07690 [Cnuella takakiae]SHF53243.1 DNA binding domain-containing protein, excisionase family [Cnuella takakiae]
MSQANATLLTKKEAASYLRVSVSTLNRWKKAGTLKGHKAGRQTRYKPEEIQAFLNNQTTNS